MSKKNRDGNIQSLLSEVKVELIEEGVVVAVTYEASYAEAETTLRNWKNGTTRLLSESS